MGEPFQIRFLSTNRNLQLTVDIWVLRRSSSRFNKYKFVVLVAMVPAADILVKDENSLLIKYPFKRPRGVTLTQTTFARKVLQDACALFTSVNFLLLVAGI